MPSRADLYNIISAILKASGVVTVIRGPFLPANYEFGKDMYPVAGYLDCLKPEQIESGNIGFRFLGDIEIDIWAWSDAEGESTLLLDPGPWLELDEIHDRFMDYLSDSYPNFHSQTTSIYPADRDAWEPFWWYRDSPHRGATLRLHYEMNYAAKAH